MLLSLGGLWGQEVAISHRLPARQSAGEEMLVHGSSTSRQGDTQLGRGVRAENCPGTSTVDETEKRGEEKQLGCMAK